MRSPVAPYQGQRNWTPRAPTGSGTNIYVATTGSNGNAGTIGSPKLTLKGAEAIAAAGSVIHVMPGTYTMGSAATSDFTVSGTSSDRITYWSETFHGAKLVGGLSSVGRDDKAVVFMQGSYLDFMGFEVDGTLGTGSTNLLVHGLYSEGESPGMHYNLVHDIVNNGPDVTLAGTGGGAGCDVSNFAGATTCVVNGNIIFNIGQPGVSSSLVHALYMSCAGTYSNNLMYNVCDGITSYHAFTGGIVLNNTLFNSAGHGIDIWASSGTADNCKVYNNIISGALTGIREIGSTGLNNAYINNTLFNISGTVVSLQNGLAATGTLTTDPQFVATGSANFHLLSSSPGRGTGTGTAPATTVDLRGRTRLSPMDRGCFEG